MTKLEQLIQDLCPNGVKFVKLGDCCIIRTGKKDANAMREDGEYPFFTCSRENYKIDTYAFDCEALLIAGNGDVGETKYYKGTFDAYQRTYVLSDFTDNANVFYLFHYVRGYLKRFALQKSKKGSIPYITLGTLQEFQIPLPPLAVQSEIVRILDKFTLYKSELAAELAARCKQYEHYREKLFTFGDDVERKTLGEIGTFTRGRRFCRTDIVEDGQSCIHYGDIYTYYGLNAKTTKTHLPNDFPVKLRYAEKGDVVIVGAGENDMDIGVGVVWEGDDPVAVHDACYIFKHNINPRYVSHYLRTINYHLQIKKYVNRGKICSISAEGVAKAVIPIPSLEIQERIASILDRFDALCNDIKIGLPAEIELRQKQYEHYRDKLLTFEAKG